MLRKTNTTGRLALISSQLGGPLIPQGFTNPQLGGQLGFGPPIDAPPTQPRSIWSSVPAYCEAFPERCGGASAPVTVGSAPIPSTASQPGGQYVYLQTIANLVSQAIQGWSRNPTQQVTGGVAGLTPVAQIAQAAQPQYTPYNQQYIPSASTSVGSGVGGFFDQIVGFATNNPGTVLLIAGGIYLLFRPSPTGRR